MFWVTLAGVIVICLYGVEESKLLIKELDDVRSKQNVTFLCKHFWQGFPRPDLQVGCGLQGKQNRHPDPGICWMLRSEEKLVSALCFVMYSFNISFQPGLHQCEEGRASKLQTPCLRYKGLNIYKY